jgi:hypothetical protein
LAEAEYVVTHAIRPYPMALDSEKRLVIGNTAKGRTLHVIFVFKSYDDIEPGSLSSEDLAEWGDQQIIEIVFVIHAMPASDKMKKKIAGGKRDED